ncbi:hypothetical protein V8E51_001882 [Hyaloscypha variabilis]
MAPNTMQNSPTVRSFRLSLLTIPALDLRPSVLFSMNDDISPMEHVKLEDVMKRLFSEEHLHFILGDHALFYRFSRFLNHYKPHLVPTLIRYLEMRKAVKAIEYANAVTRRVRWPSHTDYCKFSRLQAATMDVRFEDYAARELLLLCTEALSAFVTHIMVGVISQCAEQDITGRSIPAVHDLVGNLAEVFCLTDPSLHENPIIFASEEFHRTTQYGTSYAIDSNCRFLQGPATDKECTLRLAKAISLGQETNEILLNYRRDGTPFANLLMCAPLRDDKGTVRYFIGCQCDITGLVIEGMGIESFRSLLQQSHNNDTAVQAQGKYKTVRSSSREKEALLKLQELSMTFSQEESDIVNRNSRAGDDSDAGSVKSNVPTSMKNRGQTKRVIDGNEIDGLSFSQLHMSNGETPGLPGVYKNYLLVRPYPSLQIIFSSPSLRLPGLLRTHLFTKIGGPSQTISALQQAFQDGASVTAKVLWLPKASQPGERGRGPAEVKPRFIHCTPLLGSDDRVGVWMIILVPVDGESGYRGYSMSEHELVDDTGEERRKLESRGTQSIDGDSDGGFGMKRNGRSGTVRRGRGDNEDQLYAEYLRSSSSTGESREGVSGTRKASFALER